MHLIPKMGLQTLAIMGLGLACGSFFSLQPKPAPKWFPQYDFEPATFQKPPQSFGPYARWWWPGNDVTVPELQREINLFADHGFGGVEVQPMSLGIPMSTKETRDRVLSWDTPAYYEHLRAVLDEARKRGITVDLTDGSGWPPGGPHLAPEDGFLTLQFASADIKGDVPLVMALPKVTQKTTVPPRLQAVVAVRAEISPAGTKTVPLVAESTQVLTSRVSHDTLRWTPPAGDWKLIAFYSQPSGQKGMTATPKQGPVVDHFDSAKVIKNYIHLLGSRTGLEPYYGNPLRAVFNDSYEFEVDRHYALNLIDYFKTKRGYDLTPWLPAIMQKGYNYASYKNPNAPRDFRFGPEDWRIIHDYDQTVGELLGDQFIKTSSDWLEKRGLLHRTQAYGMHMDMMAVAGLASIPETESMVGPEAIMKVMASGAHLYNRPILSAESAVFINRAYTMTPQKIRLAVDKLFAAGVNQVIYHGVPYRYTPATLSPEGWYPFSTPLIPFINFSTQLGEGNAFWKYQAELNSYISRTQYALRSGKPHSDVLIYFPFTNVDGMPDNPEEIMTKGYLPGVEAPLPANKEPHNAAKERWATHVYPLINQLEARGISWEWVNDASIQQVQLTSDKQLLIRGNRYQALVLADSSTIQLPTARQINRLAATGMNLLTMGTLPTKQPSYLNWRASDTQTANFIASAVKQKTSRHISDVSGLSAWLATLRQPVRFDGSHPFSRQIQREMSDGSRIQFLWNKSDQWQTIFLTLAKTYASSYWLNAETGTITRNNGPAITYRIAPYSSVILYASTKTAVPPTILTPLPPLTDGATLVGQLTNWAIKTDRVTLTNSPLFDWKTSDSLRFSSEVGQYTTSFTLATKKAGVHYLLDLGKVYFTAEVQVNGQPAGRRIYAPYQLDITPFVSVGTNQLDVQVTPTELNGFIGKGTKGDSRYKQFKGKTDQAMSAGLLGPVRILEK